MGPTNLYYLQAGIKATRSGKLSLGVPTVRGADQFHSKIHFRTKVGLKVLKLREEE
jgi:hypothetical protein